jgi:hypothetical protein
MDPKALPCLISPSTRPSLPSLKPWTINYKDTKAKCRHLQKFTCRGLCGRCLSEAQNPKPPPPLTHCIRVYCILIHTGKGGGGEMNQRLG